MKLTYRQWMYYRDYIKEELAKVGKERGPKAEFTKTSFAWDFHHAYPPSRTRLHFEYNEETQQLTGWRGPNWTEGPFGPQSVAFDEEYLKRVTAQPLEELAKLGAMK